MLCRTSLARFQVLILLAWSAATQTVVAQAERTVIDFERHVAPLFARHGCNTAACHGAFGGRGGLQLSLFGYSPQLDFENLSNYADREDPDQSLMLRKPAGQEEHEGGVRFAVDSRAYQTIRRWIEQGADWQAGSAKVARLVAEPQQLVFSSIAGTRPGPLRRLTVTAEFADGSCEDVTPFCQFSSRDEGVATVSLAGEIDPQRFGDTWIVVSYSNVVATTSVLVARPRTADFSEAPIANNPIDARINQKLNRLNIQPAPPCDDATFLRRIMLDTIGTIPTPQQVAEFCESTDPDKREQKIDEFLSHPMHAALWATRMCDITKCDVRSLGEDETTARRRAQMWHNWFRKRFAENRPYDEIVRGIITATSREGRDVRGWMQREEALIYQIRESFETSYADRETLDLYWRRSSPDGRFPLKEVAELTAVAFTGVRLNCAQCHKHPFDRWTQDDYAAFANIFSHVLLGSSTELNVAILDELEARRQAKRNGDKVRQLPSLREVFVNKELGQGISGSQQGAKPEPRPLDGEPLDADLDFRDQFFAWLVQDDNPYFARNFVNRVWAVYFGIGIVDPVDDFSAANPPSHPQLLQELGDFFRESNFNVRKLEKRILMSEAYQRSAVTNDSNRADRRNFARQQVRPLIAEVMLDILNKALGVSEDFGSDAPADSLAIEVGSNQLSGDAGRVLRILGRGERESICDCDRRSEVDLRQSIFMMNDQSISEKIRRGSIRQLLRLDDEPLLQQLYLRVLSRHPEFDELKIGLQHLAESEDRETAFDDLVWALINAREFITNH